MKMVLHDITAIAGPDEHCPEFRAGLEELGWQVLGRVRLATHDEIVELMENYDPALAPALLEKELTGTTVLRERDGTSFAFVDWFFRCPFTRLMTLLDDGRLVETHETWTSDPVEPRRGWASRALFDRRREQTRSATRGRSIVLVDDPGPAELVRAHREHVARVVGDAGASPAPHISLAQAMDLFDHQLRHGVAVGRRAASLTGLLTMAPLVVLYIVLMQVIPWGTDGEFAVLPYLLTSIGGVALVVVLGRWLMLLLLPPVGYVRAIRPAFRGMAPVGTQ
ncbi:hypothetical protein [Nocardioides sp.]|uniref:hypothetical protein n=1 Tax=Nocardioides sp. TaxID=35761 RepID=UPI002C00CABF|nr:hypothetical protein [Nocardioides sp.]HXH78319.1 hypothetical protein [Nocardioides sp.]